LNQQSNTKKNPGPAGFTGEFYRRFKKEFMLNSTKRVEEEGTFLSSSHEARITLIPKLRKSSQQKKTKDT
jgi:hypothetical protein